MFIRVILKSRGSLLEGLTEFEKYLREYDVDLLLNHDPWARIPPVFQILFFKLCGFKMAMQFHVDLNYYVFDFTNILSYRLADALISLSETRKVFWNNYGVRSYFVPHPLYIEGAENFHGRDAKKSSNTILFAGRIAKVTDKNTFAILPILKEVIKTIPTVKLKILGEIFHPEVFQQMKRFITENHLENNVEFCGYHTNVAPFYESADIVLHTSPSEGWSLVIAESKFYELPLVLYELTDNELLRDDKGYVAVPQGDFKAAAQAIVKILTDTKFRCKLSAEARESIQPFLDYDIAGAWQKVFDDLENDVPVAPHSLENEKIQTLLVKEVWEQKKIVQYLAAQINQLKKS